MLYFSDIGSESPNLYIDRHTDNMLGFIEHVLSFTTIYYFIIII